MVSKQNLVSTIRLKAPFAGLKKVFNYWACSDFKPNKWSIF